MSRSSSGISNDDASNRLDDALEARLLEWENLYSHPNFVTTYSDVQLPTDMTQSDKYLLAAQWLKDGLSGRKIDFPQNSFELRSFKFARSRATLGLFSAACFVHLTLPFLYAQMCPYEMATSGVKVDFKARLFASYPTVETLMAIEFLVCIVYFIELASRLLVNNLKNIKEKRLRYDMKDKWNTVRLVCVSAIFIELVYALSNASYVYHFRFCLIPIVYITGRRNLRNMLHGMLAAMLQTKSVILLLLLALVIWAFAGYLLFHKFESVPFNRFETYGQSFMTCLHVFASRTFSLLAMNPYYEQSHASPLFFDSLSIVSDLLVGSLLIAVGTRAYRIFANKVFKNQMKQRRVAVCSIHKLLARGEYLQLNDWIELSVRITGRHRLTRQAAKALFIFECANANDVCLDLRHFFRLVGLATANIVINIDDDSDALMIRERDSNLRTSKSVKVIESKIDPEDEEGIKLTDVRVEHKEGPDLKSTDEIKPEFLKNTDAKNSRGRFFIRGISGHFSVGESGNLEFASRADNSKSKLKGIPEDEAQSSALDSTPSDLNMEKNYKAYKMYSESVSDINTVVDDGNSKWCGNFYKTMYASYHNICVRITKAQFSFEFWSRRFNFCFFDAYSRAILVLLAIQLAHLTSSGELVHRFGPAFEALFWIEMLIRMGSFRSLKTYFRITAKKALVLINIASLILGICCGYKFSDTNPVAVLFIVVQVLRFLRAIHLFDSNDFFESLLPVIVSVAFLIFAFVYFFAAFAQNRFCSAMEPENVYDADDDSANWAKYENQLNFKTFHQSLHTMFQVAIVGSWSMVMDTAAKEFPISSLFFFYSYRLFMTLTVMPILFSFIIQIYIIRRDLEDQGKRPPAPVEESGDRNTLSMVGRDESMAPSSAAQPSESTDVSQSRRSVADDVSSFVNSMAAQHPELVPSVEQDIEIERRDSERVQRVRRSSLKAHIETAGKDTDLVGLIWNSDPTSMKRRPVEAIEAELREVKDQLATALRLLQDQRTQMESENQMLADTRTLAESNSL